ncbi:MAG: hypothetical protein JST68_27230 [Bacteroidetes bacterium]|nr:hypothetical protein [Bacteroidota bacterium]
MLKLVETQNKFVTFVLHPRNYTLLYNKLKADIGLMALQLFARPDVNAVYTYWSTELPEIPEDTPARNFHQLTEQEKDVVADEIESAKASILARLENNPDLKTIAKELLLIPSEKDVLVVSRGSRLYPVLTQWGCRLNDDSSNIDPLAKIIDRPRLTSAGVLIELAYTDGTKASQKEFYIGYMGKDSLQTTNDEGLYDRGRCKLETNFTVFDVVKGQQAYVHTFTVVPNGSYKAVFPYFTTGSIKVVDQDGQPYEDVEVSISYDGAEVLMLSGPGGQIPLEDLESGKTISFGPAAIPTTKKTQLIRQQGNDFLLQLDRPPEVVEPPPPPPPEPKFVKIRLVGHRKQPLPGVHVELKYNGKTREEVTDAEGYCTLPHESFVDKEKVTVFIDPKKNKEALKNSRK